MFLLYQSSFDKSILFEDFFKIFCKVFHRLIEVICFNASTATLLKTIIASMINRLFLNRVAIWRPKLNDELSVRQSPAGRVYFEHNIAKITQTPTYRYAKNYALGKGKNTIRFCLMLLTPSQSEKAIENFLDEIAKQIDIAFAQQVTINTTNMSFEYTDFYFNEEINNG